MKIAFCLFKYFPYGGLQRDFLRIANICFERGHEVHVYTMSWEGDLIPGFHVHCLSISARQNHTKNQAFAETIKRELQILKPDLVMGFNKMPYLDLYYAADVCFVSRAKEKHSFLYRLLPRYRQLAELENSVFSHISSTEILLIAHQQQHEFQKNYQTQTERFHLLPPGISRDRMISFESAQIRESLRASFDLNKNDILMLMVGSGFKTKGLDRAMHALAFLNLEMREQVKFFVIGQDNPDAFKKLATQLKIEKQIYFLGGRSDVPDFLFAADFLIHPAYHENTGTVLLEAIISGLPVLTTDVCGYAHYVKDADAGIVINSPFQQLSLNLALIKMLTSTRYSTWKKNGISFSRTADIYSMPNKTVEIIEEVGKNLIAKNSQAYKKTKNEIKNDKKIGKNIYLDTKIKKYFSQAELNSASNDKSQSESQSKLKEKSQSKSSTLFNQLMSLTGECFRNQKGRMTQRVKLGDENYFIKQHHGVGWKEIFKNILQLRWPVLGAKPEKLAIEKLQLLGLHVPKIAAFGQRGMNPARLKSFILMQELSPVISLEELCMQWKMSPPNFSLKFSLIKEVARIAKTMHENGINHRDFYICHFLLEILSGKNNIDKDALKLYLIDLHRAQIHSQIPERWIIKDLAGLYFSSKDIGLTKRDLYRFIKFYTLQPLREVKKFHITFWQKVKMRGEKLYREHT